MKYLIYLVFVALALTASSAAALNGEPQARQPHADRSATFVDNAGTEVGTAKLTETPNGVLLRVELHDLPPGWHAFHVHEHGKCEKPDFKSAGGHFGPRGSKHGMEVPQGPHAGDMPNIFVAADGKAKFEVMLAKLGLRGDSNALSDKDGSALVVHGKEDDYRSQPSGAAGARIACAEIR